MEERYTAFEAGSEELIAKIVHDHAGWAEAIARNVARSWNLDWQLDGLDGGAYEALLFCARRFDPKLGVPFRAYARKRIHEGSTEEARKSKSWQRGVGANTAADQEAREISFRLFEIFPELREGYLPSSDEESGETVRSSVRQMLSSATVLATFNEVRADNPEAAVEYKQMLRSLAELEPVHQAIIWGIYWNGQSMRALADEWQIDELTVIREHREIIGHIHQRMCAPRQSVAKRLKVRPSLRTIAMNLRKQKDAPPFARFALGVGALLLYAVIRSAYYSPTVPLFVTQIQLLERVYG